MIRKVENSRDWCFYTCKEGDSLDSVAQMFGVSTEEILKSNPLFSKIYPGCVLFINDLGKEKVIVRPMENLESIASRCGSTKERIMELNNLKSDNVFVGMQLVVEKGEKNEKDVI